MKALARFGRKLREDSLDPRLWRDFFFFFGGVNAVKTTESMCIMVVSCAVMWMACSLRRDERES